MSKSLAFFFLFFWSLIGFTQNTSPYKTELWKDGAYITGMVGLNVLGVSLVQNKPDLSEANIAALDKNDLWKINRSAAGNYNQDADQLSYIPFYASFATPLVLLAKKNERNNFGQISVLLLETMATIGALFTITAGSVEKSRPLVYNENLPVEKRTEAGAQRAFFAGHTAATAAATLFTAKIFQDFNPDSRAVPYVWAGAVAIPAYVGYLRTKAGKHFLTDNLIGFGIGAACGILVPEIHKIGNESLDVYPTANFNVMGTGITSKGIVLNYFF